MHVPFFQQVCKHMSNLNGKSKSCSKERELKIDLGFKTLMHVHTHTRGMVTNVK